MPLNDLIVAGELNEPGSVTLWVRGEGHRARVLDKRPFLGISAAAITCRLTRQEIVQIPATLIDPARIREFQVRLRGAVGIAQGREQDLALAQTYHGGIDLAAREALRNALNRWKGSGEFASKLFPPGAVGAAPGAIAAALEGLREIGLDMAAAVLEPVTVVAEDRVVIDLGPKRVQCSDGGGTLSVTVSVELDPDEELTARRTLFSDPVAGKASITNSLETLTFNWLQGRYSRHQHTFSTAVVTAELRGMLDGYCRENFGRKIAFFKFANGVVSDIESENQHIEFTTNYKIAANTATIEMIHRCEVVIIDVGRAPGGLPQRRREAEERIKAGVQSHILSYSENKVLSLLHTFPDGTANDLSEWALRDDTIRSELASRGLALKSLYIFTTERKTIPTGQLFRHVTDYAIRGTKRSLTLSHDVLWVVGEMPADQRAYIECGAPAAERFEQGFLAGELDLQTKALLLDKPFGAIVFDYFREQETAENTLSADLQRKLSTYSRKFGVNVTTVTTVFTELPEAALLKGKMILVPAAEYSLAESSQQIELGASVVVRFSADGDGSLLKRHLSGDDPKQIFDEIRSGIAAQIRFFMASVEPWRIFSMRDANLAEQDDTISKQLHARVGEWLGREFGLEVAAQNGFVLQIGKCALLEARRMLIGLDAEVLVDAKVHSKRLNWKFATEVGADVGVKVPYRVAGVAEGDDNSRRFMEALGSSGSPLEIKEKIENVIRGAIAGLMQVMPLEAFIRSNFSLQRYRELIADLSAFEVRNALGLEIVVSRHRVLPEIASAVVSQEAIEHQETLSNLIGLLAKEERRPDPELPRIANLKERIAEKKRDLEEISREQGVGGQLDTDAIEETAQNIGRFLSQRNVKPRELPRYYEKDDDCDPVDAPEEGDA